MDVPSQELVLTSMTLRGVGSYFFGERLELKPLTILCGENGSGKSTWFKALNLLKESQQRPSFPFHFEADDKESWWHNYANAYLKMFADDWQEDLLANEKYGPVGTIGLHFHTNECLELEPDNRFGSESPTGDEPIPRVLLLRGRCPKGTRFRIRLAHPDISDPLDPPGDDALRPYDLVELQINDSDRITFRKDRSDKRYSVECSRAFLAGQGTDTQGMKKIAEYDYEKNTYHALDGKGDFEQVESLCQLAISRIQQLIARVLRGIFFISAIRKPEERTRIEYAQNEEGKAAHAAALAIENREVGPQGQWTWDVERAFAYNLMRQSPNKGKEPAAYDFTVDQLSNGKVDWISISIKIRSQNPSAIKRIWELSSEAARVAVLNEGEAYEKGLIEGFEDNSDSDDDHDSDEHQGNSGALESIRRMDNVRRHAIRRIAVALASLLNELLDRCDLYQSDLWTNIEGEARTFAERGPVHLSNNELRRFNRRLIEFAFQEGRTGSDLINRTPCFRLEMYVSYWFERLVQTEILLETQQSDSLGGWWTNHEYPPAGFLESQSPNPGSQFDVTKDGIPDSDAHKLQRFVHACFGPGRSPVPTAPHRLSAGFHQIAPIVVQCALLKRHEILSIENPEVHLHPSLQLSLTDYLIREANTGKMIVVETHSDLVVRRVLRAILAEDIAQSNLAIYFTSLENMKQEPSKPYPYSKLERLQVNDRGQVSNWPKGFMDDDVKEARRLLDAIYGPEPEINDEEGDGDEE